ncbi:MAG: ABC transporter substrate-binding protein [Ruminococcaceae bacterium]|nr:ABC transporter substrate-binding protein [Oscillospiraceae bacterium]
MKRWIALVLLLVLLTGCTQSNSYLPGASTPGSNGPGQSQHPDKKELRLPCNLESSFHPYTATDLSNRTLLSLVYQGLFTVDADYRVSPMLCDGYQMSEDMRVWKFRIADATFSDGHALTAFDVAASLKASQEGGFYAGRLQHIKTIEAIDGQWVEITLNIPMNNLPLLLDIPIIKESQLKEAVPLGTGPYILEDTETGKRLRRQPGWWCDAPLGITAAVIPLDHGVSQQELWDLYKFSGTSMVCTDAYVDFRGDYELWESENGLFLYLSCNLDSPVFSKKEVRSALTHAIDRDSLVKKHYRGFAHATTLPASPSFPYYSQTLAEKYGFAPEKFAQAVENQALAGTAITLLVNRDDPLRLRVAQDIAAMLTNAGLVVTIPEKSGEDYRNALQWGQFDLVLGQTKLSPNMDLTAFFAEDGALNFGRLTDVAANAMCREALADKGNYQTLHRQVMEDGRLCPILVRSDAIYGRRGLFSSLTPSRDRIFYYSIGKTMEEIRIAE